MKKFLLFTATAAVALLTACSSGSLYNDVRTEETYRRIKDTNPQDLGIKTVAYTYKITGGEKIDAMTIRMMVGDRLSVTYSKNTKPVFTCIMNKDQFIRINADKKTETLTPAAAGTLKFFYDINFKDPSAAAALITLRNPIPTPEGKDKKAFFYFDVKAKEGYGVNDFTLKVNAKTGYIEAFDCNYKDELDADFLVRNVYKNIAIMSGLTVAQTIESDFLGKNLTFKLANFAVNSKIKAEDFTIPGTGKDEKKTK
ncbi:MAG: hypothetical protein IKB16_04870 [Lentisphaeria bacterium]|nr:hypothetical protein [Lentisphaeria bacterium]